MIVNRNLIMSGILAAASTIVGAGTMTASNPDISVCTHGYEASPKLHTGSGNPLLDFMYVADPTAIEHEGRIYVYGTNDQQEIDSVGRGKQNSYADILSFIGRHGQLDLSWHN